MASVSVTEGHGATLTFLLHCSWKPSSQRLCPNWRRRSVRDSRWPVICTRWIWFIFILFIFKCQIITVSFRPHWLLSQMFWFLPQAQQSLDLIQGELSNVTDNADDLIENGSLSSQRVRIWGVWGFGKSCILWVQIVMYFFSNWHWIVITIGENCWSDAQCLLCLVLLFFREDQLLTAREANWANLVC